MIENIDITGLKSEQVQHIKAIVDDFKAQNKLDNNEPKIDMIEYLLDNPIEVDNLEFIKQEN